MEDDFIGIIDFVIMKVEMYINDFGIEIEEIEIFEEYCELVEEWCEKLVEVVVEIDEEFILKYLEGEEIIEVELKEGICCVIVNVEFYLVLCGLVFKNKGV